VSAMESQARPADDLTKPLGTRGTKPAGKLAGRAVPAIALLSAAIVAALAAYLAVARDPLGGEPIAVATIEKPPPKPDVPTPPAANVPPPVAASSGQASAADPNRQTAAELEEESGVVVVRRGGAPPGSLVLKVPDEQGGGTRLAPAPDKRLVEKTRDGVLPKVGADGAKPATIYARPMPALKPGRPRIAVFVGGLGIGVQATNDAIGKLPPDVTLAFAPYGTEVERQVGRARETGHEVLLQVPMEPFDYPDNDPGPQTLLAAGSAEQNLDRLHWLMSRFQGYFGITNFMGGKFTASDAALTPLMRELAGRGLVFIDDASSMRSVASANAATQGLPAARADIVIDAQPRGQDIDAALTRLEALAKAQGSAIGVATALPASVDRIARWAKTLEQRGIDLVPVSTAIALGRRTG